MGNKIIFPYFFKKKFNMKKYIIQAKSNLNHFSNENNLKIVEQITGQTIYEIQAEDFKVIKTPEKLIQFIINNEVINEFKANLLIYTMYDENMKVIFSFHDHYYMEGE